MTVFRHRVTGPGPAGDLWTTTLHSQSASSLTNVHTAWQTLVTGFITTTLGPMWPNEVSATQIITDQLDAVSGKNTAQLATAVSLAGTGTGATLSQRNAVVISLRSAVATKRGRGRMYWPSPDASHLSPTGLLLSADASTLATAFASRLNTFKATSVACIWHQDLKTFDNVTQVQVGVKLGIQMRRDNRVANSYSTATV